MIGQTLGPYRILEKIGAGGMGEVFRASDPRLERDVALKVLPAGRLADPVARRRFRTEALALAKLNHPNIEAVYEFDTEQGVDFLAMELIPGRSLDEILSGRPFDEAEVRRLGVQLAQGLEAAHAKGIVHRDLKPANLRVTPAGQLKILDFGLAALQEPAKGDLAASLTQTQGIVGTLPYMAPEQLRGEPADARTDIYGAGAVLYEMAVGSRPFPHTSGPELMGAILHTVPVPLRVSRPGMSPALEQLISKALAKEPGARQASASELRSQLEATEAIGPRARIAAISAGVLLLLLLGAWTLGLLPGRGPGTPGGEQVAATAPAKPRRPVAVLGFSNVSGRQDAAWLSTAFSEMLTSELSVGGGLRTIPEENVALMKADMSLDEASAYAAQTLKRIRSRLGAEQIVLGSYVVVGEERRIRLDLRVQETQGGETTASFSESGAEAELLELVARAGARLREAMGAGDVAASEVTAARAAWPSNVEAARFYAEGIEKLRLFDARAARDRLERAVAADPKSALAQSALSEAWTALGYSGRAAEVAQRAFALSESLPREERLLVEARYRAAMSDWPKAVETFRALWTFFPDNLEYGLTLAKAQALAGNGQGALATVEALRALPPPARDDPRIDLEEARAASAISDFKREHAALEAGARKAEAAGARLVLARARQYLGGSLLRLGESQQAIAMLELAQATYASAGDSVAATWCEKQRGVYHYRLGDLTTARRHFEQALASARNFGNPRLEADLLGNLGMVSYDQGDLAEAQRWYEQALTSFREVGSKVDMARIMNGIANILADQGKQAEAKAAYEQSLALSREIDSKVNAAIALGNLGTLAAEQGRLDEARERFEEALEIKRQTGNKASEAYTISSLGDLLFQQGDLAGARSRHEEALEIRTQIGQKGTAAEERLALAAIALEEGEPAAAEAGAREAAAEFETEKRSDFEARARALLARCLLARGSVADARIEIDRARELAAKSGNRVGGLGVAIEAARVEAAAGEAREALVALAALRAEAGRSGLAGIVLDARLAEGEIELRSGEPSGRAKLADLEAEARAKGFGLVALRAAACLQRLPGSAE